jgi:outer membrane protein assembly factor BamE (lipoprotein component of BamABCDE complex)
MTENQVMSIIGRPDRTVPNLHYETWRYGLLPGSRLKVHWAFVNFDPDGRVTSAVNDSPESQVWPRGRPAPGMTKQQVLRMIGKPDEVHLCKYVVYWSYDLWNKSTFQVMLDRRGRVYDRRAVASRVSIKW